MDTMITPQFIISVLGGAVATSILAQMVKNAFNGFLSTLSEKYRDLLVFLEVMLIAGIVAWVWEQGAIRLGLEDQLTFGVRWIFYLSSSSLVYRWFTKKVMPDFMKRSAPYPD